MESIQTKEELFKEINSLRKQISELKGYKEQYKSLIHALPDAVAILDLKGKIMDVSQRSLELYGCERAEEIVGKSAFELVAPENKTKARKDLRETLKKGILRNSQHNILKKDGSRFLGELSAALIRDSQGKPKAFIITTRDITQQKKAEKIQASLYKISEATQSAQSLDKLYCIIHETISELMPAKNNFYIALYDPSQQMLSFPYFVDEYEGPPSPRKLGKGLSEYVLRTGKPLLASPEKFKELQKQGEVVLIGPPAIDWLGIPLKTKNKTIGVMAVQSYTEGLRYTDEDKEILTFISEQVAMAIENKQAETALRESEEKFRSLAENSPNMIFINSKGRIVYVNPECEKVLGYTREEFYSPDFDFYTLIAPESINTVRSNLKKHMNGKEVPPYEYTLITKHGKKIDAIHTTKLIYFGGEKSILGIITDITTHKKSEEKIRASIKEKDVLLQEIHHRVKNNMQIISSLLNLQLRSIKDEKVAEIFRESRDRIRSMALIHEKLYQSKNLARINFAEYIKSLVVHLFNTYKINPKTIRIKTELEDVFLDVNSAIPCSLIINELVTNVLKHAFPKGRRGEIRIKLQSNKKRKTSLIVSDNGIGYGNEIDFRSPKSLGLQLVNDLVKQINGSITLERKKGTTYKITF